MQRLLAVASSEIKNTRSMFKELQTISKRTKISMETLLKEEVCPYPPVLDISAFKSYPYITLSIPNYEQHRQYLESACRSSTAFKSFILLISSGDSYEDLVDCRSEELLRAHCRSWNAVVSCVFDSSPLLVPERQQKEKISRIFGQMDVRGKVSEVASEKKFHLIEKHSNELTDELRCEDFTKNQRYDGFRVFFGIQVGCARKQNQCVIDENEVGFNSKRNKKLKKTQTQAKRKVNRDRGFNLFFKEKLITGECLEKSPYLKKNHVGYVIVSDQASNQINN